MRDDAPREMPMPIGHRAWFSVSLLIGVLGLPTQSFPPLWIFLFAMPGVLYYALRSVDLGGDPVVRSTLTLAGIMAMQFGLILLDAQTSQMPRPEVALTFLLLAPLAFAATRAQQIDVLLGLFLSLCLLLIGAEFRGDHQPALIGGFLVASCMTLRLDARRGAMPRSSNRRFGELSASRRSIGHAIIVAAVMAVSLGLHSALTTVPALGGLRKASRAPVTAVGVDSTFSLDGQTMPLQLRDDELVIVRPRDDRPLPRELYLRATFFDVAGLGRWQATSATKSGETRTPLGRWSTLREPFAGARVREVDLERTSADDGFLWLPPGTVELRGSFPFRYDPRTEHGHEVAAVESRHYSVRFQTARVRAGELADRFPDQLRQVPRNLPNHFLRFAEEWTAGVPRDPVRIANALIAGLRSRCRYNLAEPVGPYRYALDNFLLGPERTGYCMHFASALALMLRCLDIPCRVAVGLCGGEPSTDTERARVFGSKHAHAWVEIPLASTGYTVFDATPADYLHSASSRWPDEILDGDPGAELTPKPTADSISDVGSTG